jgi:hypothetical protein
VGDVTSYLSKIHSERAVWVTKAQKMFAAQFKSDRDRVLSAARTLPVASAPYAISTALQSAPVRSAWSALYMQLFHDAGLEFAYNTQQHLLDSLGVDADAASLAGARAGVVRYATNYIPDRVDQVLANTVTRLVASFEKANAPVPAPTTKATAKPPVKPSLKPGAVPLKKPVLLSSESDNPDYESGDDAWSATAEDTDDLGEDDQTGSTADAVGMDGTDLSFTDDEDEDRDITELGTTGLANGSDLITWLNLNYDNLESGGADYLGESEGMLAANVGQQQGAYTITTTLNKVWSATEDKMTRPAHAEADGQTVPIHESFDVGGDKMLFPLDGTQGASIANLRNCRCACYFELPEAMSSDATVPEGGSE